MARVPHVLTCNRGQRVNEYAKDRTFRREDSRREKNGELAGSRGEPFRPSGVSARHVAQESIGAEIGTHMGDFSHQILRTVAPAELHLIDPWKHETSETYKETSSSRKGLSVTCEFRIASSSSGNRAVALSWRIMQPRLHRTVLQEVNTV
jgi:hypothetical protein